MRKAYRVMVFSLFVFSLFSSVFAAPNYVIIEERVETKCQVLDSSGNVSVTRWDRDVTLNGSVVEEVECGNLDDYSFPEPYTTGGGTEYITPSLPQVAIYIGLPVSGLLALGFGLYRRYSLGRRRVAEIFGITFGTLTAVTLAFIAANEFLMGSTFKPAVLVFLMFGGPLLPSVITYLRSRREGLEHGKPASALAFLFSVLITWTLFVYYEMTMVVLM